MDEREVMYRLSKVIEDLKALIRGCDNIDIQDATIMLRGILEEYEAKFGELPD